MDIKNIFYKGYRLCCVEINPYDNIFSFKAKVLGRNSARYIGLGHTRESAIEKLKIQIDMYR